MMTSAMSGGISDSCKDCLITCIPTAPVGDEEDGDRPELNEPDSGLKPSECVMCLLVGSVQL